VILSFIIFHRFWFTDHKAYEYDACGKNEIEKCAITSFHKVLNCKDNCKDVTRCKLGPYKEIMSDIT